MIKRHMAAESVSWMGKAWEIRIALRLEMTRLGGDMPMAKWMAEPRAGSPIPFNGKVVPLENRNISRR